MDGRFGLGQASLRHATPRLAAVWDDASVRWEDFNAVVMRSVWDYHHRLGEFLAGIADLGSSA